MNKVFVSYELALKLKEKGFNEPCFGSWLSYAFFPDDYYLDLEQGMNFDFEDNTNHNCLGNACSAPLYQQLTDWLREKHDIHIHISRLYCYIDNKPRTFDGWCVYVDNGIEDSDLECNSMFIKTFYPSYSEALDKAIEETLKLI